MNAICPDCKARDATAVERERTAEGGLAVTFACAECSEEWHVTF